MIAVFVVLFTITLYVVALSLAAAAADRDDVLR